MDIIPSWNTILTILMIVAVLFILFKVFKMIFSLLVVIAFFIFAYITNPDLPQHKEAILKKAKKSSVKVRRNSIEIEDFKILSFTKLGKGKNIVGIGAFTQVWIFDDLNDNN